MDQEINQQTLNTYNVFRKFFHIPSKWKDSSQYSNFAQLFEMSYTKADIHTKFNIIMKCFKSIGYLDKNDAMLHDYIHFMIIDILKHKTIPFIDEHYLISNQNSTIYKYLQGCTPDLIISGKNIVDIYVGNKQHYDKEKKHKYKHCHPYFSIIVITPFCLHNLTQLKDKNHNQIFQMSDIDYLQKQYRIFLCEYQYWLSCLSLGKILINDYHNVDLQNLDPDIHFVSTQEKFIQDLNYGVEKLISFSESII